MAYSAARARHALGILLEGDEREALRSVAQAKLRALGVADPDADLRAEFPELVGLART
jgi:hypothetical protein